MDQVSLRKKQMDRAMSMLTLSSEWQPDWKLLIYDNIGKSILNPLLSLDKLRGNNVTLHLSINCDRDPIPDVSAIYFVMPTDDNIERICKDLKNLLYDFYYLNFVSPLPESKLRLIAEAALASDSASKIRKVYDQYLNFIALEDYLFILKESDKQSTSFYSINRPNASASDIDRITNYIVESLFSVLVTLQMIPVIRCPKGGPAQILGEKLSKLLKESLRDEGTGLFEEKIRRSGSQATSRPLLCIVDRTVDMSTPLHHTWTYQALIHDLLDSELNKVQIIEADSKSGDKSKSKIYDLDPGDKFWIEHKGSPFPQVADAVQRVLNEYKKRDDELNNLESKLGLDDKENITSMLGISTTKLTDAARSIPELSESKRILRKHTNVASAVLEEIKARKLDNFFEIEEKIMNGNQIDRVYLDEMLTNPEYGEPNDKYRLFLISYICDNPSFSEDEAERYVIVLEELGCTRFAFDFIKQWKTLSRTNVTQLQSSLQSSSGILKTAGMFSKLMSKGSKFVMEGVKNLVLKEHYLPLTKIVDGLMDSTSKKSREAMQYLYFDPISETEIPESRIQSFQEAILFVVGGGNYAEYQNLVDYCKSKSRHMLDPARSPIVIYGSTSMMNANQFLRHIGRLGT